MSNSYFNMSRNVSRLYAFYGNIKDLYFGNTLCPLTLPQTLHQELLMNGYKRVILFDYGNGAFFLDKRSRKLWDVPDDETEETDDIFPNLIPGEEEDDVVFSWDDEEEDDAQDLSIKLSAEDLLRNVGVLLLDAKVPTAVIFTNGIAALKLFHMIDAGQLFENFMQEITQNYIATIGSRNTVIFLFNGSKEEIMKSLAPEEYQSFFGSNQLVSHSIPMPDRFEVRRMLNYLRICGIEQKKLLVDVSQIDELGRILAARMARSNAISETVTEYKSMSELIGYLDRMFIQKGKCLSLESCNAEKSALKRLESMIGIKNFKECIHSILELDPPAVVDHGGRLAPYTALKGENSINLHFALKGNPGVGKSTVAEYIGEILGEKGILPVGHIVKVLPADLTAGYVGQSEEKTSAIIQRALGGVLFIDEAYGLVSSEGKTTEFQDAIITTLTGAMTSYQGQFSVVIAGYSSLLDLFINKNPGLQSRFANTVILEDYTPEELTDIFAHKVEESNRTVGKDLLKCLSRLCENMKRQKKTVTINGSLPRDAWANGREMENLFQMCLKKKRKNKDRSTIMTCEDLPDEYLNSLDLPSAEKKMNDLIGLENLKEELANLKNAWIFGEKPEIRNYIFSGNAGTGKNTAAALVGDIFRESGMLKTGHVVTVHSQDFLGNNNIEITTRVNRIFELARDGVLFIDEAYGLLSGNGKVVLDLILKYTEEGTRPFPVCVICAGYPNDMELFIHENDGLESRFKVIRFESYTGEQLMEILKRLVAKEGYTADDAYYDVAVQHIQAHYDDIANNKNARYMTKFFQDSVDCMRRRVIAEKKNKMPISGLEKHFIRADCP